MIVEVKDVRVVLERHWRGREPDETRVASVTASIASDGLRVPIELDDENELVHGLTRLRALQRLGVESVRVSRTSEPLGERVARVMASHIERPEVPRSTIAHAVAIAHAELGASGAARSLGRTAEYVRQQQQLASLEPEVAAMLDAGQISVSAARAIASRPASEQLGLARVTAKTKRCPLQRRPMSRSLLDAWARALARCPDNACRRAGRILQVATGQREYTDLDDMSRQILMSVSDPESRQLRLEIPRPRES